MNSFVKAMMTLERRKPTLAGGFHPSDKEPFDSELDRKIEEIIDRTFMRRGFNAKTHRRALLEMLKEEGYVIVKKTAEAELNSMNGATR